MATFDDKDVEQLRNCWMGMYKGMKDKDTVDFPQLRVRKESMTRRLLQLNSPLWNDTGILVDTILADSRLSRATSRAESYATLELEEKTEDKEENEPEEQRELTITCGTYGPTDFSPVVRRELSVYEAARFELWAMVEEFHFKKLENEVSDHYIIDLTFSADCVADRMKISQKLNDLRGGVGGDIKEGYRRLSVNVDGTSLNNTFIATDEQAVVLESFPAPMIRTEYGKQMVLSFMSAEEYDGFVSWTENYLSRKSV